MARCGSLVGVNAAYTAFLFATVFDDRNDMPVSVLSALARLNLDAWQEASDLARLPSDVAAQRIATRIRSLPGGPCEHLDATAIAARLVTLLPRIAHEQTSKPSADQASNLGFVLISCAMILASIVGTQWAIAQHASQAQIGGPRVLPLLGAAGAPAADGPRRIATVAGNAGR